MIANDEAIVQDQLMTSAAAGKVRVHYPRGAATIMSIGPDGVIQSRPDSSDGPWEQATIVNGGSGVLFLSDTPTSKPTILLGANLKAL